MMREELLKGQLVEVQLETFINQNGEVHHHIFDEMGRIVKLNEHYYIRFEETNQNQQLPKASITIKIHPQGRVTVIRNGEQTTRLVFDKKQKTISRYATPAGLLELDVSTTRLQFVTSDQPFSGALDVDYHMVSGDDIFGRYQMHLRFTT